MLSGRGTLLQHIVERSEAQFLDFPGRFDPHVKQPIILSSSISNTAYRYQERLERDRESARVCESVSE
jgi:hypothetical protein